MQHVCCRLVIAAVGSMCLHACVGKGEACTVFRARPRMWAWPAWRRRARLAHAFIHSWGAGTPSCMVGHANLQLGLQVGQQSQEGRVIHRAWQVASASVLVRDLKPLPHCPMYDEACSQHGTGTACGPRPCQNAHMDSSN